MSKILQNILPFEILASKVPKLMKSIEQERGFGSHPQKIGVVITLRKYEKTRFRTKGDLNGVGSMSRPQLIRDHVNAIISFNDFGITDIRSFLDIDADQLKEIFNELEDTVDMFK